MRTLLVPLVTPACLLVAPMLGLMMGALVIMVCVPTAFVRLLLQPFRRDRPTQLVAWRLPVTHMSTVLL